MFQEVVSGKSPFLRSSTFTFHFLLWGVQVAGLCLLPQELQIASCDCNSPVHRAAVLLPPLGAGCGGG